MPLFQTISTTTLLLPSTPSVTLVLPEICLVTAMGAVLLAPFLPRKNERTELLIAMAGVLGAMVACLLTIPTVNDPASTSDFVNMLSFDPFSQFFKLMLLAFTAMVLLQWYLLGRKQNDASDTPDFLCLLLGAAFGMMLMASANNLLMIVVAIESASLPSYALAGFRKKQHWTAEGSLKYVVFGAASSAIMIYGISLIYGLTGTLNFADAASRITALSVQTSFNGTTMAASWSVPPLLIIGILGLLAGVAFKLSAVPLHFWCPDVFQGAPTQVTTFLSVASKGAAVCLLVRILTVLAAAGVAIPASLSENGTVPFMGVAIAVAIVGAITATWGNLAALAQLNIKRLLAYSSIAHAGYMIMTCSLILVVSNAGVKNPADHINTIPSAVLFYLLVYLFMNLGAFTVAAIIEDRTGSEDIREYAGLIQRSPVLAVLLTIFMLSLFGMPGLGGFWAKIYFMQIMAATGSWGFVLIAVLLINTLFSLYFYMRPVYYAVLAGDKEGRPSFVPSSALGLLAVSAAFLLWTGLIPNQANHVTTDHSRLVSLVRIEVPVVSAKEGAKKPAAKRESKPRLVPQTQAVAQTQPATRPASKRQPATQPATQPTTQPVSR